MMAEAQDWEVETVQSENRLGQKSYFDDREQLEDRAYLLPDHKEVSFEQWERSFRDQIEVHHGTKLETFEYMMYLSAFAPSFRWIFLKRWRDSRRDLFSASPYNYKEMDLLKINKNVFCGYFVRELVDFIKTFGTLEAYWQLTSAAFGCYFSKENSTLERGENCDSNWFERIDHSKKHQVRTLRTSFPIVNDVTLAAEMLQTFSLLEEFRDKRMEIEEDLRIGKYFAKILDYSRKAEFSNIEIMLTLCSTSIELALSLIHHFGMLKKKLKYGEKALVTKSYDWFYEIVVFPVLIQHHRDCYRFLYEDVKIELENNQVTKDDLARWDQLNLEQHRKELTEKEDRSSHSSSSESLNSEITEIFETHSDESISSPTKRFRALDVNSDDSDQSNLEIE